MIIEEKCIFTEDVLRKYYKTADDEEPDCLVCDLCRDSSLCDKCGPKYGWYWYKRSLMPDEVKNDG